MKCLSIGNIIMSTSVYQKIHIRFIFYINYLLFLLRYISSFMFAVRIELPYYVCTYHQYTYTSIRETGRDVVKYYLICWMLKLSPGTVKQLMLQGHGPILRIRITKVIWSAFYYKVWLNSCWSSRFVSVQIKCLHCG